MKRKAIITSVILFMTLSVLSQCEIKEARELIDYKRTKERIAGDETKLVVSKEILSSSKDFTFEMELFYQVIEGGTTNYGMHKGNITFGLQISGDVQSGVVYYTDGTFKSISPFEFSPSSEISKSAYLSFTLVGGFIGTDEVIGKYSIESRQREEAWLGSYIDLRKIPSRIVFLTSTGSKELNISQTDYLTMQCVIQRYSIPHAVDIE